MPPVQKWLVSYYLQGFSEVTGFTSAIGNFKMLWFDHLELRDVTVYDPEGNKMIHADEIMINFELGHLIHKNDINIDGVYLDSAHVFITRIHESDTSRDFNMNIFIARINENFSSGSSGSAPPRINIGEAFLNRSQFTFINPDRDSVKTGFNYNQFSLAIDEGQLESFVVIGDTTQFDVRTLIAQDLYTKFSIKQLSTFFRISQKAMEFSGLNLLAGESIINDTIIFHYDRQVDLNEFIDKVKIHASLTNTRINHNDLALFAPGVERLGQPIEVNAIVDGKVSKLKVKEMDVRLGNTTMLGSLDLDGLPEINETFIILNIKDSRLDPKDIAFLFGKSVMSRLEPMGILSINGQFLGYPTDFVANGSLIGKLGVIRSDINFKVNEEDLNRSEYSGKLLLSSFQLGRYLKDTAHFQNVNLNGRIVGSGLTTETADFRLTGKISSIGINGYNYTNITTDARLASGLFRGFLAINDPNLELTARGSVDLREGRNQIKVQAQLDTAFLHRLNLSQDEIFLHSSFDADVQGLTLDSLQGGANFSDVFVRYGAQSLAIDQISLNAQKSQDKRSLQIRSSLVDVAVDGDYLYSNLTRDIPLLMQEISLNIKNDQKEIQEYYRRKKYSPASYEAAVHITLKEIEPIVNLVNLDLQVAANTEVEAHFKSGYTTILNVFSRLDSIQYKGTLFTNTEAELTASKIADSTTVLAMATVTSDHQIISDKLKTKNLLAEGIWSRNHIDFGLDADQDGETNYVRLKGGVDFLSDSTVISMDPSHVRLLEREWNFADHNFVTIKHNNWTFNRLALLTGQQSIALHGKVSRDPAKVLTLKVDELDLSLFNVLTNKKIAGTMNAEIALSNFFNKPNIQNAISIDDLTINEFLIGNINGNNLWDTTQRKFNISLAVDRNSHRMVNISGDYNPANKDSPLNITADLQQAHLKIAEPFLIDIFSHIGGTVSGGFKITGSLDAPLINGEGVVDQGQLMINYLQTLYRFKGKIGLTPTSIYFKDIELTDALLNNALLNGVISHQDFAAMTIDMDANFKNFQVLNTTIKDNDSFYGQAYASGRVWFAGPLSNLRISSAARTEKNTRIYIPITGKSTVEKKDFINFVSLRDTTTLAQKGAQEANPNKVSLTGVTVNLNLDVTPDAYCEIIFDLKTGDIIRGRGNGVLKLELDTKGEFNMFGPFEFTQGWYNFTLYDIINKEFEIQKGSKITWYGDPYEGVLDINASYNQLASLAPLIQDPNVSNTPQLRRKYPVQVLLKLKELMLTPQINFDIVAKDLPKNIQINESQRTVNLDIEFAAFKNKLDEQELARQVFSLIVLRKFSPPESFNTSGSVVNSVSELLSNQLSYWMSQVDQNLEIDVDLGIMDEEAFNTFQLRFSYTFLNGRLRITGDGTYNNTSNTPGNTNQPNPSSVAGDWTVEYMLTADGKLRMKMYSRTNVNPVLSSVNNQTAMTTGASIMHTQSFNELKDLWRSSRKRRQKREAETLLENTEAIKEEDVVE